MRLNTVQQLKLEQKLAPRLIQAMEILQLPITTLEERLIEELEKNPTLEVRDPSSEQDIEPENRTPSDEKTTNEEERELIIDENFGKEDFSRLEIVDDIISPDTYDQRYQKNISDAYDEADPKLEALANTADRGISLNEHLMLQWDLLEADPIIKKMGEAIINSLEPDGYLRTNFSSLAAQYNLPNDDALWENALKLVQKLDPPGIAARNIKEALLLQLKEFDEEREVERILIEKFFDELQNHEYQKIANRIGVDVERIKEAIEFIKKRLSIHPGRIFENHQNSMIIPDIIIEYDEETEDYKITIKDDNLPQLYIPARYQKMLNDPNIDNKTREYIRRNIQSAKWIIDAIAQRKETLRKVVQSIVAKQKDFLELGPQHLKPLPMAAIAEELGVHIATISRAVSGKYVQTPRGIYPLKAFFVGGREKSDGEAISWNAIKEKIKELIDKEDKKDPLSDDKIVELLKRDGIDIARRTVAKYRKQLGIPSSHKRKEK